MCIPMRQKGRVKMFVLLPQIAPCVLPLKDLVGDYLPLLHQGAFPRAHSTSVLCESWGDLSLTDRIRCVGVLRKARIP